ncbi:MAG: hypothetical protein WA667_16170 [Candidatus Nitrosopolaris sp.]
MSNIDENLALSVGKCGNNRGRTVREIAGLVHMSFRDIGAITNKVKLQADRGRLIVEALK